MSSESRSSIRVPLRALAGIAHSRYQSAVRAVGGVRILRQLLAHSVLLSEHAPLIAGEDFCVLRSLISFLKRKSAEYRYDLGISVSELLPYYRHSELSPYLSDLRNLLRTTLRVNRI